MVMSYEDLFFRELGNDNRQSTTSTPQPFYPSVFSLPPSIFSSVISQHE
jgi:hypothetical protein